MCFNAYINKTYNFLIHNYVRCIFQKLLNRFVIVAQNCTDVICQVSKQITTNGSVHVAIFTKKLPLTE